MARRDRYKGNKDKCDGGAFLKLPLSVLTSQSFMLASSHARMLLLDLAMQYRGDNNGDLSGAWSFMKPRGWRSKETLTKAKRELEWLGLIVETRKGARPNKASLYACTWWALDDCGGKLEIGPQAFPRGAYQQRDRQPIFLSPKRGGDIASASNIVPNSVARTAEKNASLSPASVPCRPP